jgi:hypothetical protein
VDFLELDIAPPIPFRFALEYAVSTETALCRRNVTLVLCALQPTLVKGVSPEYLLSKN